MKLIKMIIFTLLLTITIIGCSKEPCEKDKTAEVRMTNISSDPYNIYIDGYFQTTLSGNTYKDYTTKEGSHTFKAVQQSGYVLYPTEKQLTENVEACNDLTITFP